MQALEEDLTAQVAPRPRRRLIGQLWFLVLLASAAGIVLGHYQPRLGTQMQPLADAFVKLVRMIIAPVIFVSVVHGITGMADMKRVGRVALKALVYFLGVTLIALVLALAAVNFWQPGAGMGITPASLDATSVATYSEVAKHQTVSQFLLGIIPDTFLGAFAQPNVLQVLLVAVLSAIALVSIAERGRPVLQLIEALSALFYRIVGYIMWVAPIGAFGALAFTVGKFGTGKLRNLGWLIGEFYGVSILFVAGVLGAIAWASGVSLWRLLVFIREEILIVAATTSTETVLPRLMQRMRDLGCEESVVGLVVPTGYSFNLDGTCLYLASTVVFLGQALDLPLDLTQQLGLLLVLLIASKGAAGVSGAALVVLAVTLGTVGKIPVAAIYVVLGIHRIMAEAMTFVNLVGNALATIVVSRWEGAVDEKQLQRLVGRGSRP